VKEVGKEEGDEDEVENESRIKKGINDGNVVR